MKYFSYRSGGVLLGLLFFGAVLLVKPIGISTQFSILGGMIQNVVSPVIYQDQENKSGYGSNFAYYNKSGGAIAKKIAEPVNYDMIFFLFTIIGGVGTHLLMSKKQGLKINVKSPISRPQLVQASVAGFALVFGARLAGGCTSGHMMSGMMQGSVGSYMFAMVVFLVAIPVAMFLPKLKESR